MFCYTCCTHAVILSTEGNQIIHYFPWLNRFISCLFIMFRKYIRKTSWEQDYIQESGVATQGRRVVEIVTLLLGNDKNNVNVEKVLSYF